MTNVRIKLLESLQTNSESTIEDITGKTITYQILLDSIIRLFSQLSKYELTNKNRIALIGENSLNWIKVFLMNLLSNNKVLLLDPNLSKQEIDSILISENINIVFIDGHLYYNKFNQFSDIYSINLVFSLLDDFRILYNNYKYYESGVGLHKIIEHLISLSDTTNECFVVYSPGTTFPQHRYLIREEDVLRNIRIDNKILTGDTFISIMPFYYLPILAILSPIIKGKNILIHKSTSNATTYKDLFSQMNQDKLILTLPIFMLVWNKYFKILLTSPLYIFLLRWYVLRLIIRPFIVKNFIKIFGNVKEILIIFNSLPIDIDELLFRKLHLPINNSYGNLAAGGIVTYSEVKKRIPFYSGKLVNEYSSSSNVRTIHNFIFNSKTARFETDDLVINHKHFPEQIQVLGKRSSAIKLNVNNGETYLYPERIEEIIKQNSNVKDAIILKYAEEEKIYVFINIDPINIRMKKLTDTEFKKITNRILYKLGKINPLLKEISSIVPFNEEIKRTYNGSIKERTLYEITSATKRRNSFRSKLISI